MEEKLFFYYTNDLHSHFENWSKIVGFFNDKKIQRKKEKQSYWLLDNGDHVDRFHPIAEAWKGKTNVDLLNLAEYDIATVGNNEGITLDFEELYHLYDQADFQVVCANLNAINGKNPTWLKRTHYFISESGLRIGVIGLTAPFNAFYNLLGWDVKSPLDSLDEYINELKNQSDIILLLSHLGINEDEEIARRYPDIDVIIGGHTHHLFRTGEYIGNTLLTAAGKHGKYVGEVILTWDHEKKQLVRREAYTTNIDHVKTDVKTTKQLRLFNEKASQILDKTVTTLTEGLEVNWFEETPLMKKLTDTLKAWTNADCAMLNAGLLLEQLEKGKVSYGDIHRICPHPINPCLVELTGSELLEVIRVSFTDSFTNLQLKGFGFRGEIIGRMVFSGIEVELETSKGHQQVRRVTVNGIEINNEKEYLVATADMFTFGQLFPEIARSKLKKYFMPEMLRDLLAKTLKENF